jgi:hypothetical protein
MRRWLALGLLCWQIMGCDGMREQACERTSKDDTLWCSESKLCLGTVDTDTYRCPEDATDSTECDLLNELRTATEKGQVWVWDADSQTCENDG